jgi:hypothetical protein
MQVVLGGQFSGWLCVQFGVGDPFGVGDKQVGG